jgi:hypothetical protein
VEETGELEPVGVVCFPDSFSCLEEVEEVWLLRHVEDDGTKEEKREEL